MTLLEAIQTWHPFRRPSWPQDMWLEPEWILTRICRGGDTPLHSSDILAQDYYTSSGYPPPLPHALD